MALMMSVSGVRGIVGQTMTPTLAAELGAAFGSHLQGGTVVLGRDSRPSGEMIKSALAGGLLAVGCKVIDLGIVTTPGTAVMIRERGAAGGIVVTASHNPGEWNGVKFLSERAAAPPPELAERLYARWRAKDFHYVGSELLGTLERDLSTNSVHVARVLRILDVAAIRRRQLKVVLDSACGAGGASARMLLDGLGCKVVHLHAEPTGVFPHPPEPLAENLTGLCEAVRANGADIGLAQDPDADRLAVVDNGGRYIGEEYTLVLAARQVLARRCGPLAANLSTSRMIDDVAAAAGPEAVVHRTPVGEAHVAEAIAKHNCVLGGEGNGGVIDPRVVMVRDSITAMGLVLNLLADDWRPLRVIVDELPRYVMIKQKHEMAREQVERWLDRLRVATDDGRVDESDGVRIDWPAGWVHVRPSNTEPVARLISEARDEATALGLAQRVADMR